MQRKKTIKILNFRPFQKNLFFASEASNISIFAINLGYLVFIFGAKIQIEILFFLKRSEGGRRPTERSVFNFHFCYENSKNSLNNFGLKS